MEIKHPYTKIDDDVSDALLKELKREMSEDHILFDVEIVPIARKSLNDDVLFQLPEGRVAVVHLTWSGIKEDDPFFPSTKIYASIEAFNDDQ